MVVFLIYLRQVKWKDIPEKLVRRIKASDQLFQVAQDNQLFLATACIAAVRSIDFSVLSN
jgi:hypothetical protein